MNNFNFVLFIYLIIYFITGKNIKDFLYFFRQTFPSATVIPKMHLLEQHVVPWLNKRIRLGFMGELGAESIRAAVYAITRAYTSVPDKVSQVQCIIHSLLLFY